MYIDHGKIETGALNLAAHKKTFDEFCRSWSPTSHR